MGLAPTSYLPVNQAVQCWKEESPQLKKSLAVMTNKDNGNTSKNILLQQPLMWLPSQTKQLRCQIKKSVKQGNDLLAEVQTACL